MHDKWAFKKCIHACHTRHESSHISPAHVDAILQMIHGSFLEEAKAAITLNKTVK